MISTNFSSTSESARALEIQNWIAEKLAAHLQIAPSQVDVALPFTAYGVDSIAIFTLTGDLAQWLERELPVTLLWEYPTIETLARHLASGD